MFHDDSMIVNLGVCICVPFRIHQLNGLLVDVQIWFGLGGNAFNNVRLFEMYAREKHIGMPVYSKGGNYTLYNITPILQAEGKKASDTSHMDDPRLVAPDERGRPARSCHSDLA